MSNIFNEKQKEAIESNDNPIMVIAGAGSGKTFVLTQRIIYLINKLGYYSNSILAFTFTNKAANEIKERINNALPSMSFNWVGTFHSICLKILRYDISQIGRKNDFIVIDQEDQLLILKEIYSTNGFNKDIIAYKKIYQYISHLKSKKIDFLNIEDIKIELEKFDFPEEKNELIKKCYKIYCQYLEQKNLLDFDDLIIFTNKIFKSSKETLKKWRDRFNYILVDEFQDTNEDQFELINYLVKDKKNIFIVGDPDQMIYSWRGSYSSIFDDFENIYKDHQKIILEKNYRSTKNILEVSNKLISNNKFRIKKNLFTDNNNGSNIIYYNASNSDRESNWIANKIYLLKNKLGYSYRDIVVLYRSNYLSRNIEQSLIYKDIPYFIFGGLKFFQRKEIKDILAFLKLIVFDDDVSLNRIYNTPKRQISESTYSKIVKFAVENKISNWKAISNVRTIPDLKNKVIENCEIFVNIINEIKNYKYIVINDLVDKILKDIKYIDYLKELDEEYRLENIDELKSSINYYQRKNPDSSLKDYLQEIALYTEDENKEQNFKSKDYVSLMTIHNAKGLEFKNVFLISFCEGLFPPNKSIESGDISEERRIAYVAMTRARENLFISSYDGKNFHSKNFAPLTPSRFIDEIDSLEIIEKIVDEKFNFQDSKFNFFNKKEIKSSIKYEEYFHEKEQEYNLGDMVAHIKFGMGVIIGIDDNTLKITFKSPNGTKFIAKNHKSIKKISN